jgi:hypothetical protein
LLSVEERWKIVNKGFSIITNFGCNFSCHYCVWKSHLLNQIQTNINTFDWNKLQKFTNNYSKISVSGGGDPFFQIEHNWNWYEKLIEVYKGKIDIHTANILQEESKYQYFNRIVLHLNYNRFLQHWEYLKEVSYQLRLVFVIDDFITEQQILEIVDTVDGKYQISFKELFGVKNKSIIIKEQLIKTLSVYYIPIGDYNIYFMPNNEVWTKFMERSVYVL